MSSVKQFCESVVAAFILTLCLESPLPFVFFFNMLIRRKFYSNIVAQSRKPLVAKVGKNHDKQRWQQRKERFFCSIGRVPILYRSSFPPLKGHNREPYMICFAQQGKRAAWSVSEKWKKSSIQYIFRKQLFVNLTEVKTVWLYESYFLLHGNSFSTTTTGMQIVLNQTITQLRSTCCLFF